MSTYPRPSYIREDLVNKLLTWPLAIQAMEQSIISVSETRQKTNKPIAVQAPRSFTKIPDGSGMLGTMLGYIGDYNLPSISNKKYNTLICKLATNFINNKKNQPPLPNILSTILIFDTLTGKLNAICEGTNITEFRTAAASIVATKALYFDRLNGVEKVSPKILAIIGCGALGRIHSIGMIETFTQFNEIHLWNRTVAKSEILREELESKYKNVVVKVCESVGQCCANADVVVTATNSVVPLVYSTMLKPNCHINAIGPGIHHYTELSRELYEKTETYVDTLAVLNDELKGFHEITTIVGQVGDVICKLIPPPKEGITVFQSSGMAVEDAVIAQLVYENYLLAAD